MQPLLKRQDIPFGIILLPLEQKEDNNRYDLLPDTHKRLPC